MTKDEKFDDLVESGQKFGREELALVLDLSGGRITQLRDEGIVQQRGRAYGLDAIRDYIRFARQESSSKGGFRELVEQEKHRQLKRENDVAEQLVAPVSLLTEAIEAAALAAIPLLEGIPLAIKRRWPEVTGDQVQLIKAEIAKVRNLIADMKIEL